MLGLAQFVSRFDYELFRAVFGYCVSVFPATRSGVLHTVLSFSGAYGHGRDLGVSRMNWFICGKDLV